MIEVQVALRSNVTQEEIDAVNRLLRDDTPQRQVLLLSDKTLREYGKLKPPKADKE